MVTARSVFSDRDSAGRRARNVLRQLRRCGSEDLEFCARSNGRPKYFMRSVGTGYLPFLIVCLLVAGAVGVRAQGPKTANPAPPSKTRSITSPHPHPQLTRRDL